MRYPSPFRVVSTLVLAITFAIPPFADAGEADAVVEEPAQQKTLPAAYALVIDRYLSRLPPTLRSAPEAFAYVERFVNLKERRTAVWDHIRRVFGLFSNVARLHSEAAEEVLRLAKGHWRGEEILEQLSRESRDAVRHNARTVSLTPELYTTWVRITENGKAGRSIVPPDFTAPVPPEPKRSTASAAPAARGSKIMSTNFALHRVRGSQASQRKARSENPGKEKPAPAPSSVDQRSIRDFLKSAKDMEVQGLGSYVIKEIAGAFVGAIRTGKIGALDVTVLTARLEQSYGRRNGPESEPITVGRVRAALVKMHEMAMERFGPDYQEKLIIIHNPATEGQGKRLSNAYGRIAPEEGWNRTLRLAEGLGVRIVTAPTPQDADLLQFLQPARTAENPRNNWVLTLYDPDTEDRQSRETYALLRLLEEGSRQFSVQDPFAGSRMMAEWITKNPKASPIARLTSEAGEIGTRSLNKPDVWSSIDREVKEAAESDRWPIGRGDAAAFSTLADPGAASAARLGQVRSPSEREEIERIKGTMTDPEKARFERFLGKCKSIKEARAKAIR